VDETHGQFLGDEALFEKRATEMQKKMTRRDGSMMTLAQSKRASELQRDITAWEDNLLLRSGVASLREVLCHP
jgi:pre-mRNA-splicing factor ATP-dependent RNA helicase DHX38/PRP16